MPCKKIKKLITIVKIVIQIPQILTSDDDFIKVLLPMMIVTVLIIYMFLANSIGQNVTDHNNEVYIAA